MSAPAGTLTLSNTFNSNGGAAGTSGVGGNGGTWSLTGLSTVSVTVACSSNGGDGGSSGGNGGNAGSISFISSASNVVMSNMITTSGGNAKAGNSSGGKGGNVIINSATSFKSSNGNKINTNGGDAVGTGSSGNGGNISLFGNAANGGLGLSETYTTTPGIVASGTLGTAGSLTVSTGNSVVTSSGANDGQSSGSAPTLLQGSASFVKNGEGTLFLGSQNNSYTGLTTVNTGILKLGANNVLGTNASGTIVNNGAAIDINNVNYSTAEPLSLTGSGVTNLGAMTTTAGSAGKWTGIVTVAGVTSIGAAASTTLSISGQINGSGGLRKVDYGTLSLLSASNNYTGSTTIAKGTLQIAAANVIPDGSAVVLTGGTLMTSGAFSETMGTLTVNAGSFLTFGSTSAHTLTFAGSNGIAWSADANITVSGWVGTYGTSTTGTTKFIVGGTGNLLTAAQLAKIQFVDANGVYWAAQTLSTGEVIPSTSGSGNTFYAIANGNWNANTTWSYTPGGAAVASGVFPTSTKNVVISGYTITLTAAAACNNITLGSAACGLSMAANDLILLGNLSITSCPSISTTGGNIVFDGTKNSYQIITSTCTNALLGNVALRSGANVTASNSNTTISVVNFTNTSETSSWVNNTSTTLTVTGTLAAPNCMFISNGGSGYNFSSAANNPITIGGFTSNSTGSTINLGAKNATISNFLNYTAGTLTSTGTISMAANSVVNAKDALTIANLQLGGAGITSIGGGTLSITNFDFNGQKTFKQTAGTITTGQINNNTGPMSFSYSGTPTFIYSGSGIIPSGDYYNLTTTTNTKSITCSSTITIDGVLTNSSGAITGPTTSTEFGRIVNANPVNNIGGRIGSSTTYLSFSGTIQGGTVIGAGTNVLQNSSLSASCTYFSAIEDTLSGFEYCEGGGPSASQNFALSSIGLTGTGVVLVTGSINYEVSTDNITFATSVSYPFADGIITGQPKNVYVRLKTGLIGGSYNLEPVIINSAGGASAIEIINNGTVTNTIVVPSVTINASTTSICLGEKIILTALPTNGGAAPAYQWSKGGVEIEGATNVTYETTNAADNDSYTVAMVSNAPCASSISITSPAVVIEVSNVCTYTWVGTVNADWNLGENWNLGLVPTSTNNVIIPNVTTKPIISVGGNVMAHSVTINMGAGLTLSGMATLSVYGDLINQGDGITTEVGSTINMIGDVHQSITGVSSIHNLTINNSSGVSVLAPLTVKGTITLTNGVFNSDSNVTLDFDAGGNIGYTLFDAGSINGDVIGRRDVVAKTHYISAPFAGVTSAQIDATTPIYVAPYWKMYSHNFANQNWTAVTNTTTQMEKGAGFSISFVAAAPLVMTGTYNHALSYTSTSYDNATAGKYILTGNPYPTTLDWDNGAGWTKNNVDDAIYYWDATNQRTATYVRGVATNGATPYIPAMQAYFVRTSGGGGSSTLAINNNARISLENPSYWGVSIDETIRLTLQETMSTVKDEAVIRFNDMASVNFDSDLDASKIMNSGLTPSVYTSIGAENYSINSLTDVNTMTVIPIATLLPVDGTYTLTVDISDVTKEYILYDKKLGVEHALTIPEYTFSGLMTDDPDRFELQLIDAQTGNSNAQSINGLTIHSSSNGFIIKAGQYGGLIADIQIMDLTGNVVRTILSQELSDTTFISLGVADGAYIVKLMVDGGSFAQLITLVK